MNNPTRSLFNCLLSFMERNRADNLHKRTGWHERLRAIYVAHHQAFQDKAGLKHPHLWEKHAIKK